MDKTDIPNRIFDRINWSSKQLIETRDTYRIERVSILNEDSKQLSLITVTSTQDIAQIKTTFSLIQKNYEKFNNIPILFEIKQNIQSSELLLVFEYFNEHIHTPQKQQQPHFNKNYIQWISNVISDLITFQSLNIQYHSHNIYLPPFV